MHCSQAPTNAAFRTSYIARIPRPPHAVGVSKSLRCTSPKCSVMSLILQNARTIRSSMSRQNSAVMGGGRTRSKWEHLLATRDLDCWLMGARQVW